MSQSLSTILQNDNIDDETAFNTAIQIANIKTHNEDTIQIIHILNEKEYCLSDRLYYHCTKKDKNQFKAKFPNAKLTFQNLMFFYMKPIELYIRFFFKEYAWSTDKIPQDVLDNIEKNPQSRYSIILNFMLTLRYDYEFDNCENFYNHTECFHCGKIHKDNNFF